MTISTTDTHPALRWGSASGGFAESDPRGGAVLGMSELVARESNAAQTARVCLADASSMDSCRPVPRSPSAAPAMGLGGCGGATARPPTRFVTRQEATATPPAAMILGGRRSLL